MPNIFKIFKYSFYDTLRSKWAIFYSLFFLITSFSLLYLSDHASKAIVSLMNVVIAIIPLVSTVFATMYFYNSREFNELLLSQPIKRREKFTGQYLGLAVSLALSFTAGFGIPFLFLGFGSVNEFVNFLMLLVTGNMLTFIFISVAFLICSLNEDKIKGFGYNILFWLFMAVMYDGFLIVIMMYFKDYPLENTTIALSILNPVDLSRILVMLKLDYAALMGLTGAVFNKFFGNLLGMAISFSSLFLWVLVPFLFFLRVVGKKDF